MEDEVITTPSLKQARALEQRQADKGKTAAATETRLGDPDDSRWKTEFSTSRCSSNRRQASRL